MREILKRLSGNPEAQRWWQALGPDERRALRRDPAPPPPGLVGRFVEPTEGEDEPNDLYEYLVNHELSFPDGRVFHICTAHPAARAVLASGRIPADFRCPRGERTCPMRVVLDAAPGSDVRISPVRA
jgi:hypothetical protein